MTNQLSRSVFGRCFLVKLFKQSDKISGAFKSIEEIALDRSVCQSRLCLTQIKH